MVRVRLGVLLLIIAPLPLILCAELSHTEETSSTSGRDSVKPTSCGKHCEERARVRKRSTPGAKCELFYFVPTAQLDEAFFFWDNTKAEQRKAYSKIASFLRANTHEDKPTFFPAHMPFLEERIQRRSRKRVNALVLKDVYVRAQGACGYADDPDYFDTNPAWYEDTDQRQQKKLEILEDYVQRIPRSHWGYRVPKADEDDVCLDESGLVVKEFPGIRTCFSMWVFEISDRKPKHFAGRQIYNRINQTGLLNISMIGYDPSGGDSVAEPSRADWSSLPGLFLKEMCDVTNASLKNGCTYWTTNYFYASLCCCYTNRTECAYRNYKFPSQQKTTDSVTRACAMGSYYAVPTFGGALEPNNATNMGISVKQFVQEKTSSEVCRWTYTWDTRNATTAENVLFVDLDAVKRADIAEWLLTCTRNSTDGTCCQRTAHRCPTDPHQDVESIDVECFCSDGDLCNKQHSYLHIDLVKKFKEAPPCETVTVAEHLLLLTADQKKPNTSLTEGYMCPVYYDFAHPGRNNTFLQLISGNNFIFRIENSEKDEPLLHEGGCHLVEVTIREQADCPEKLFGEHNELSEENRLVLLCAVEGNPLGARRKSYPDAKLKKTIEANLTAAKEAFPTCKNGSLSLDFESLSELVMDNTKLFDMYNDRENGTNDNITTVHCFVEVSFVYQKQYNLTFGALSIENKSLHDSCHESEAAKKCVRWNSAADDEQQHFACCCQRHWSKQLDMYRQILLDQLKPLLWEITIAETPGEIMSELKKDPLTKCDDAEKANDGQSGTDINRPCARNEGCYTGVHARDVPPTRQHKKYGGCVSEYVPGAKKRDDSTSDEVEARFSRICRIPRNQDHCFAVLGTEDAVLPDDVKGPQMVCCCKGRLESAQKCGTSRQFGTKIGDYFDFD